MVSPEGPGMQVDRRRFVAGVGGAAGLAAIHLSHIPLLLGLTGAYAMGYLLFWRRRVPFVQAAGTTAAIWQAATTQVTATTRSLNRGVIPATLSEGRCSN